MRHRKAHARRGGLFYETLTQYAPLMEYRAQFKAWKAWSLSGHFPSVFLNPVKSLGVWFLVGSLHVHLPAFDVLGGHAQERQQIAHEQRWKTVENTIRETTAAVKQIAERLSFHNLIAALADMN